MSDQPKLVLHAILYSHPCIAVTAALDRNGLEYETVNLVSGQHGDQIEEIYGEGNRTVPGLLVDDEPVHGTQAIFDRIDQLSDDADLYPAAVAAAVREAEQGVAEDLQTSARNLIWGALHFRPEALGTFGGPGPLDPAGVDFAIKLLRGAWRYTELNAVKIAADLEALPDQLDIADELIEGGVVGGSEPTAVDFQIGSSLQLLMKIGDVRPLIEGRPSARLVSEWFGPDAGDVPAGAFPAGWVPEPTAAGAS